MERTAPTTWHRAAASLGTMIDGLWTLRSVYYLAIRTRARLNNYVWVAESKPRPNWGTTLLWASRVSWPACTSIRGKDHRAFQALGQTWVQEDGTTSQTSSLLIHSWGLVCCLQVRQAYSLLLSYFQVHVSRSDGVPEAVEAKVFASTASSPISVQAVSLTTQVS